MYKNDVVVGEVNSKINKKEMVEDVFFRKRDRDSVQK